MKTHMQSIVCRNVEQHSSRQKGAAAVEVVMATAASFVMVTPLCILGTQACRNLGHIVITLVGWPYL